MEKNRSEKNRKWNSPFLHRLIALALEEDIGVGDATTGGCIDPSTRATALIKNREACTVAGLAVVQQVCTAIDPAIGIEKPMADGEQAPAMSTLAEIHGPAASILTAERCALNFLQRLCGIATLTHAACEQVQGTSCRIVDTRKTTPGWRFIEKMAVRTFFTNTIEPITLN